MSNQQDFKGRVVAYRHEYAWLLQNMNAAMLMSQIDYWYRPDKKGESKLTVCKGGKWWLAKTAKMFSEETLMSVQQVRDALAMLVRVGLIETENHRYKGIKMVHLRYLLVEGKGPIYEVPDLSLIAKSMKSASGQGASEVNCSEKGPSMQLIALDQIAKKDTPVSSVDHMAISSVDHIRSSLGTTCLTETTAKTTSKIQVNKSAAGPQPAPQEVAINNPEGDNMTVKLTHSSKQFDSAKSILTKMTTTPAKQLEEHKVAPYGLYLLWAETVPKRYPDVPCITPFNTVQYSFVKQMITLWGEDCAREILVYVIENWVEYVHLAQSNAGAFNTPSRPNINFLYKYRDIAKNLWLKRVEVKKAPTPAQPEKKVKVIKLGGKAKPVQLTAPVPLPPQDDGPPMTLEELTAWKIADLEEEAKENEAKNSGSN